VTGLIAKAPVNVPVFSFSVADWRSRSDRFFAISTYASTAALRSGVVIVASSGCSGASTQYVAPKSVSGPRREHDEGLVAVRDAEGDLGALAPADPVALHLDDPGGPVEAFEIVEQAIGVRRDAQHPLAHRAALDRVARLHVLAVLHLFVREDGPQRGAPVHRHLGQVREPFS
jgi:hypothetical protein